MTENSSGFSGAGIHTSKKNFHSYLEKKFKLSERNSTVKTEIFAGITSFMTIAYILAVIPANLSESGMPRGAVFTATAIASIVATLIAGFYGNLPFILAPLLGFESYFVFSIVVGMNKSWQFALTAVFLSSVILLLLTIFKVREALFNVIPENLKTAMVCGLGLFITFIGLANAGIVQPGGAIVTAGDFSTPGPLLALLGIIGIAILNHYKVKGAFLIVIIASTLIGIPLGVTSLPDQIFSLPPSFADTTFKFVGFSEIFSADMAICVFIFVFMSIFNNIGTVTGLSTKAELVDENGKVEDMNKSFLADSIGSIIAGCLGSSTIGTTLESSSGIAEGGRTGLTAITTSFMLILALFLSPLFLIVPAAAITPVLVSVGLSMMSSIKTVNLNEITEAIPAFLTIVIIPLTYSISDGIMLGILSYVIIKLVTGKAKEISIPMYIMGALFLVKMLFI